MGFHIKLLFWLILGILRLVLLIKGRWRLVWIVGSEFRKIPKVGFNFSNFGCFCLGSVDCTNPGEVAPKDHV